METARLSTLIAAPHLSALHKPPQPLTCSAPSAAVASLRRPTDGLVIGVVTWQCWDKMRQDMLILVLFGSGLASLVVSDVYATMASSSLVHPLDLLVPT